MENAEHAIISFIQMQCYKDEIETLKSGKKKLKRQRSLFHLDPVVRNGILCVGGRLKHCQTDK